MFSTLTAKIGGGIIIALLLFAGVQSFRLSARTAERDVARASFQTEVAKHSVSLASIKELRDVIDAKNAESDARAKAYADSKAADAKAIADLDRRFDASRGRIATLSAIAKASENAPADRGCRAPSALLVALDDL
ncbi:MAG: hypothetical protein WC889_02740 [Myxococcota bacterium]|jgi:hypothetical protein